MKHNASQIIPTKADPAELTFCTESATKVRKCFVTSKQFYKKKQNCPKIPCRRQQGIRGQLILPPEGSGEEDQDGHDLETPHEHEQAEHPLDVDREDGPGERRADVVGERRTDVADAAQRDDEGIGQVDAGHNHHGGSGDDHEHGEHEEGKERHELGLGDALAVDLDGQHGVGMENLAEIVADDLQEHGAAHALEAAAGAAGTGAEIHDNGEDDPRQAGPVSYVVAEHARGGHERDYLEESRAEGVLVAVVEAREQEVHDPGRGTGDDGDVEPELGVAEDGREAHLDERHI